MPIGTLRLRGRKGHTQQPVPRLAFSKAAQKSDHGLTSTWNVGNVGLNRPYVILCQFTSYVQLMLDTRACSTWVLVSKFPSKSSSTNAGCACPVKVAP